MINNNALQIALSHTSDFAKCEGSVTSVVYIILPFGCYKLTLINLKFCSINILLMLAI